MAIYNLVLSISAKSKVSKQSSQIKNRKHTESKLKQLVISNGSMGRLTSVDSLASSCASSEGQLSPPANLRSPGNSCMNTYNPANSDCYMSSYTGASPDYYINNYNAENASFMYSPLSIDSHACSSDHSAISPGSTASVEYNTTPAYFNPPTYNNQPIRTVPAVPSHQTMSPPMMDYDHSPLEVTLDDLDELSSAKLLQVRDVCEADYTNLLNELENDFSTDFSTDFYASIMPTPQSSSPELRIPPDAYC